MKYNNIIQATFISRPNRFIAEVDIDGCLEIVHVKNTGRCKELLKPGSQVWLTAPGTPGRKTKYDLVAVQKENGVLFNIDSQAPNKVAKEWLIQQGYDNIIPEYRYGESRIDFYMERHRQEDQLPNYLPEEKAQTGKNLTVEKGKTEKYLMEVKGCTLEIDGVGYFPDAPTERGIKHIRELIRAREAGYHSILAFVIQMDGVTEVRPNRKTHPEFGEALDEAEKAGVEILLLPCHVEPDSLEIIYPLKLSNTD